MNTMVSKDFWFFNPEKFRTRAWTELNNVYRLCIIYNAARPRQVFKRFTEGSFKVRPGCRIGLRWCNCRVFVNCQTHVPDTLWCIYRYVWMWLAKCITEVYRERGKINIHTIITKLYSLRWFLNMKDGVQIRYYKTSDFITIKWLSLRQESGTNHKLLLLGRLWEE